jgi:flagella basal body P-ring formation protein FlgA
MNMSRRARLRRSVSWLAGCSLGLAMAAPVAATQAPDSVRAAAEQAVRQHFALPGSRLEVSAAPLSARLTLADCTVPLRTRLAENAKPAPRMSVQVQCLQPDGWDVRVTVQLQLFRTVLVASRPLLRGDGLRANDVRPEERDITRLGYGYIDNLSQTTGRSLARTLAAGSVLTPAALGGRRMVSAGDHVLLVAKLDSIEVRANGVALGGGDNGARLRVRNDSSGKVIDAMVTAPGEVVALP